MILLRYWPHLLAAIAVAAIGYSLGAASGDKRAARAELALSHVQRDAAQQIAAAEASARESERTRIEAITAISAQYEATLHEIETDTERRTADLRAGNLRLRHEIAALATASVSREAAATAESEAAAARGAELVAAAVGVGAACDARQRALIEAYEAMRRPAQ